jgi:hypothetical protein
MEYDSDHNTDHENDGNTINLKNLLKDDDIIRDENGLVFNPYNPLNVEITLNDVQSILTKYGVPGLINNVNLYKRAFVHK